MNRSLLVGGGLVVLVLLGLFLIFRQGPAPASPTTEITQGEESASRSLTRAPEFKLQDYSGKTVSLSDFSRKPLVINSWAAWCPFCREELKDFSTVQEELRDNVVIIAVDRAEPLAVAKQYTDELGVTGELVLLLDPNDSFYRSIGGFSMPETIFVDANGNIQFHKRGPMPLSEIRLRISKLLEIVN
ncbi:MAG: TlpA family protein disulfide reductase [Parcubacteria group bacterium]|nr:TlpA family protein disulfide reductase [Parcubacteria group bacterium]